MNDTTETKKSRARSAAMARTWAARRDWAANPVCCCGCGAKLVVSKAPEQQRLFCQGHDGRLCKFLRRCFEARPPGRTFRWRHGRTWHESSLSRAIEKFKRPLRIQISRSSAGENRSLDAAGAGRDEPGTLARQNSYPK